MAQFTGVNAFTYFTPIIGAVLLFMPEGSLKSYTALACILCFLLFMQMPILPIYWLPMAELFPMRLRGVLTGTAVACRWVFSGLVALLFPIAMAQFGSATFFVFAAIDVMSLIFVAT